MRKVDGLPSLTRVREGLPTMRPQSACGHRGRNTPFAIMILEILEHNNPVNFLEARLDIWPSTEPEKVSY